MIFVDYIHTACDGEGCAECNGTGMVGKCITVDQAPPKIRTLLECLPFAEQMQDARRPHRIGLRKLAQLTGMTPSRMSEIEQAHTTPTDDEKTVIREALAETWPREE